ncbi:MAG TPA: RecX family transcriptional regulator [Gaiellaceae bacterium]|nr:RecX family transcriptional regulator [Gaiellaceae bacterium]
MEAGREAVEAALRVLRGRDLSRRELDRRLAERGFAEEERGAALETLERTGLVDDARFAEARARALAGRGAGDALVRHELARAGVPADMLEQALAALEPEEERVRRIVARRGASVRTARYLLGKGFADDVVGRVVAGEGDAELA